MAYSKEYYEAHRQEILEKVRIYQKENKDKINKRRREKAIKKGVRKYERQSEEKSESEKVFLKPKQVKALKGQNNYKNILIVEYKGQRRVIDKETYELIGGEM